MMVQHNHINKPPKAIKFAENQIYRNIPNREEIEEIRQQVWFTDEELTKTLTECVQTVAAMQGGIVLGENENDSYTSRGLEYMTSDGFRIANSNKEAVKLVLEEQERQRKESGSVDPEKLAAAIESASRHRMRIAQLTGQKDERAAKNIVNNVDTRNSWTKTNADTSAELEEVKKRIAERRKFREGSRRRLQDDDSAPTRAKSDIGRARRSRSTQRERGPRVRNQRPQRAASLDVDIL